MTFFETKIPDLFVIEPKIFKDERGFFYEVFQKARYKEILGIKLDFVQDNFSYSTEGVLRGLHYQIKKPQGKLINVLEGSIFDVAVDIRKDSSTFGQWFGLVLSDKNNKQLWLPPGMAHGFLVLSSSAKFFYKCTDYYDPSDEGCILWNDPSIDIDWPSRKIYTQRSKIFFLYC